MQNVSKRTILWIVPLIIIGIFWYFYGPQDEITDNEYITYIKETTINENTFERIFAESCEENKWVYFKTQKNHNVVEFKGKCTVAGQENNVNLQFVVEKDRTGHSVGALLLDGVQQSEDERTQYLNTIASN